MSWMFEKVSIDSLRANIAIATQENILFSDTVAENIRYAAPEASIAQVTEAAVVACADEFIDELPIKYDTPLGERATKLSSGQRQRIVIARAIIKDAPILILDEPTAALDAETELRVLDNLKKWGENRSIFLITHRLSTIRQADKVVYLRDGIVLAQGTHDELLRKLLSIESSLKPKQGNKRECRNRENGCRGHQHCRNTSSDRPFACVRVALLETTDCQIDAQPFRVVFVLILPWPLKILTDQWLWGYPLDRHQPRIHLMRNPF
ncbi:MAG: hypothetical protein CM1200mP41_38930 [Gammaproteobacteria bacterium]|nr:MAG: hypothetical protein CM1200mP41_38930 [Gammaproteobacteria bacterium]